MTTLYHESVLPVQKMLKLPPGGPPLRSDEKPTPEMTVAKLANLALLDVLSGAELVVYLRLVAETRHQGGQRVSVRNAALHRNQKSAWTALSSLEKMGLIKMKHDVKYQYQRTIEVIR